MARRDDAKPPRVGRYEVVAELGRGWLGTIVEARDPRLGRTVALKLLNEGLGERHTRRLMREARACARLSHPNVVQVYEVGEVEGRRFIAMERVEGQTLRAWQQRRPGWRRCVRVYRGIAEGLAAAHAASLVHRDLKPEHCILDRAGTPRVLGFGRVASVGAEAEPAAGEDTETETQWGTPEYMPPEQVLGGEADALGDQYSFCVSLFEAVYGERPFPADGEGARLRAKMTGRLPPAPR
ncbi:MAG: serine/threonine protein kinase, partial [Myxococcales bacterium]|nr:serine/threonine protein kinase [Myxococcales bacterium]